MNLQSQKKRIIASAEQKSQNLVYVIAAIVAITGCLGLAKVFEKLSVDTPRSKEAKILGSTIRR